MGNLLHKPYIKYPLAIFIGLSISIFYDWLDGGIQFTLR